MRKIVHVINNLQPGGAEVLLKNISNVIFEDYEIHVVTLNSVNLEIKKLFNSNVTFHHLTKDKKYSAYLPFLLVKKCYQIKPKIIFVHLFPSFYYGIFLKCLDVRLVLWEHSTSNKRRNLKSLRYFEMFVYSFYDDIICGSEGIKEALLRYLNFSSHFNDKVKIIQNGILIKKNISRKKLDINKDYYDLCMIARFEDPKDFFTVIKSFSLIKSKVNFHFFGYGTLIDEVIKFYEFNKYKSPNVKVKFHGYVSKPFSKLKKIDIAILSSKWEGFGIAALETMSVGIPTIGTDVIGLNQILFSENLTFDVGDFKELAERINNLLGNPKLYESYSQKCINNSKKYDLMESTNDLKTFIDNI